MIEAALLIIDMQTAMFSKPERQPCKGAEVLSNIKLLLEKAREINFPVIFIQHTTTGDFKENTKTWEIYSELLPIKDEPVIQKTKPNAFYKTGLQQFLQERNIHKLIITGMQSDCCVRATCKGGFSAGYEIVLAGDAHSTFNSLLSDGESIIKHINETLSKKYVTVKTTNEILEKEF
jgi:nicotinamidase-related amidase